MSAKAKVIKFTACAKKKYHSMREAAAAARWVCRVNRDARPVHAYQCKDCAFPDGRRAWHWGHLRPGLGRA